MQSSWPEYLPSGLISMSLILTGASKISAISLGNGAEAIPVKSPSFSLETS